MHSTGTLTRLAERGTLSRLPAPRLRQAGGRGPAWGVCAGYL